MAFRPNHLLYDRTTGPFPTGETLLSKMEDAVMNVLWQVSTDTIKKGWAALHSLLCSLYSEFRGIFGRDTPETLLT